MRLIRRLIISISAVALALAIGGWLLDHTVFRSSVILDAIHSSGTCRQIADAAPGLLVQRLALPAGSEQALHGVVTPTYVCAQLNQFLPQLEAYYRSSGPAPILDLSNLAVQIKGVGVPLPQASEQLLATPIRYSNSQVDQPLRHLAQSSQRYTGLALLVALFGMVLVWLISGHKRWREVASIWAGAAVSLALEAGLIKLIPALIASPIASSWLAVIAPPVRQLADTITTHAARQFLIAATICLVIAIIFLILSAILSFHHKHPHKQESATAES